MDASVEASRFLSGNQIRYQTSQARYDLFTAVTTDPATAEINIRVTDVKVPQQGPRHLPS